MKAIMLSLLMLLSTPTMADTASYYHDKFHGRKTASGEVFNQHAMTAASNKYKMGSRLLVTNPVTNCSVVIRVTDTGQLYGRTIDLSKGAFSKIADLKHGVIKVTIKKL